jgi:hypothetical protein
MRLIGIGLLAFLLAGLALLLTRSETIGQSIRAVESVLSGPHLRFETPMAPRTGSREARAIIQRAGPNAPLILTGLPAFQRATFHMPIDAVPTSGYLQIDATSQVLDGVEAVLRVSIDNTRRAEVLLHPGEATRSVRIELTAEDMARAQVVVSFSLQGTGPHTVCRHDDGISAVVEIETTSAIHLTLDEALSTPRDRIAAWGDRLHLAWRAGDAESLRHGVEAARLGADVHFLPNGGFSPREAAQAIAERRPALAQRPIPDQAWSHAFSANSDLWGARRFRHEATWRIDYDLRQSEARNLPAALLLSMRLGQQASDAQWHVRVMLNGRLLADIIPDGTDQTLNERIPLPRQGGSVHRLEITASSTARREGQCSAGPALLAEVLPGTRIVAMAETYSDPITSLRAVLAETSGITYALDPGVTAAEARVAVTMIAALAAR